MGLTNGGDEKLTSRKHKLLNTKIDCAFSSVKYLSTKIPQGLFAFQSLLTSGWHICKNYMCWLFLISICDLDYLMKAK